MRKLNKTTNVHENLNTNFAAAGAQLDQILRFPASILAAPAAPQISSPVTANSYDELLRVLIQPRENATLFEGPPTATDPAHLDVNGRVAIGFGYDLDSKSLTTIQSDFTRAGIALPGQVLTKLTDWKNGLITNATLITDLSNLGFSITRTQATLLFDNILGQFENAVDTRIGTTTVFPESVERAIAVDLAYQNLLPITGETVAAIRSGNYTDAYLEIRFLSNANVLLDARNEARAILFGLYSYPTPLNISGVSEALNAARAVQLESSIIQAKFAALGLSATDPDRLLVENFFNQIRTDAEAITHGHGLHIVQDMETTSSIATLTSIAAADLQFLNSITAPLGAALTPGELVFLPQPGGTLLSAPTAPGAVPSPIQGGQIAIVQNASGGWFVAELRSSAGSAQIPIFNQSGEVGQVDSSTSNVQVHSTTSGLQIDLSGAPVIRVDASGGVSRFDPATTSWRPGFSTFSINAAGAITTAGVFDRSDAFSQFAFLDQDLGRLPEFSQEIAVAGLGDPSGIANGELRFDLDAGVFVKETTSADGETVTREYSLTKDDGEAGTATGQAVSVIEVHNVALNAATSMTIIHRSGSALVTSTRTRPNASVEFKDIDADLNIEFPDALITLEQFGSIFGSTIGRHIAGDNIFAQIALSATLGTVVGNFGELLDNLVEDINLVNDKALSAAAKAEEAFDGLGDELVQNIKAAGIGAISSFLTAELFDALGIDGFAGEFLNTVTSAPLGAIIANIDAIVGGENIIDVVDGNVDFSGLIGGFLGRKLASEIITFDTIGGQLGSTIGSGAGAILVSKFGAKIFGDLIGKTLGNFLFPGVGAFLGFIVGGLIGSIFGGTPRSAADVKWDPMKGEFVVANAWARKGGNEEVARDMAQAAANTMNNVLGIIGGTLIDGESVQAGTYGLRKKDTFTYRDEPSRTRGKRDVDLFFKGESGAERLLNHGVFQALDDFKIAGGEIFMKRAFYRTIEGMTASSYDADVLLGNLSFANDYATYQENAAIINALIAAEPDSAFSAGWVITLQKAVELGLHKRHESDFYGGWDTWLADNNTTAGAVAAGVAGNERHIFGSDLEGNSFVEGDTIDSAGKDVIVGQDGVANSITLTHAASSDVVGGVDRISSTTGLTINGEAADGSAFDIEVAAEVHGGDMGDTIVGGDLGNDLYGHAGDDTLTGGSKADWLFGGDGADTLYADKAGGVSDGNYLDGGAGDDTLVGRGGSDWLAGGAGVDTLQGGEGGDILDGGATSGDSLEGGGGNDTYVFRRGDGADTVIDTDTDFAGQLPAFVEGGNQIADWRGLTWFENGAVAGGADVLAFGEGIAPQDIWVMASGDDLKIGLREEGVTVFANLADVITLKNWFKAFERVETFRFADGTEIEAGHLTNFVTGTAGNDNLRGTVGNDWIHGAEGSDTIFGMAGDDVLLGGSGGDLVYGDEDDDIVSGGTEDDQVFGNGGNDTVGGGGGDDIVRGGAGADSVSGGTGNDTVFGGEGNDRFLFGRGDGKDRLFDHFSNTHEVEIYGWSGSFPNLTFTANTQAFDFFNASGQLLSSLTNVNDVARVVEKATGKEIFNVATGFDAAVMVKNGSVHLDKSGGPEMATDSGEDVLEFGIGISANDLDFMREGDDLIIGVRDPNAPHQTFDELGDMVTISNWYHASSAGKSIETFWFANTGNTDVGSFGLLAGGTDGDDTVTGTASRDWLTGGLGDDALDGSGGDDILSGHAGDDTLTGGAGADVLMGGVGVDMADYTGSGAVNVDLGAGTASGGDAAGDILVGIEGLKGSANNDTLAGDGGTNVLEGMAGNDTLRGAGGADTYVFNRGDGADTIHDTVGGGDAGQDLIRFGDGITADDLRFTVSGNNLIIQVTDGGTVNGDQITVTGGAVAGGGERMELLRFADGSEFDISAMSFSGSGTNGDDWLVGTGSTDSLVGQDGNDVLNGGAGDDTLQGNQGDDFLIGGAGADSLQGFTGDDTVSYVESDAGVTVDLDAGTGSGGHAQGDTLSLVEHVIGSDFNDTLTGSSSNNVLMGGAGADTLTGNGGNDSLEGGDGADTATGGDGDDFIDLGEGDDVAEGGGGNDALFGGIGADTLKGDAGDDLLVGDLGDDTLEGGAGDDTLAGDGGSDVLKGGAGDDVFVFGRETGSDTVHSLAAASDHDHIVFDDNITSRDLWLRKSGNDLIITVMGGGSDVTVKDWFAAPGTGEPENIHQIQTIAAADGFLDRSAVQSLVDEMARVSGSAPASMPPDSQLDEFLDEVWTGTVQQTAGSGGSDSGGVGSGSHSGDNQAPVAADQIVSTRRDASRIVRPLTAVDDPDGDEVVLLSVQDPANGSVSVDFEAGEILYTPNPGHNGEDWFDYTVSDGKGGTATGTIRMTNYGSTGVGSTIDGTDGPETLTGTSVDDTINGLGGDDVLDGGTGHDDLFGGAGDDLFIASNGADLINGGTGFDTVSYANSDAGVRIRFATGDLNEENRTAKASLGYAAGDQLSSIESVIGSPHSDSIFQLSFGTNSSPTAALIDGGAGNDSLGGPGEIRGGTGNDKITGQGVTGVDNWLFGEAGDDTIKTGSAHDIVYGGTGNDTITVKDLGDVIEGDEGDDRIIIERGGADITAGAGDDTIVLDRARSTTIHFAPGDGQDVIEATELGSDNKISFEGGIEFDQLWFARDDDDLVISVMDSTDKITLKDWYDSGQVFDFGILTIETATMMMSSHKIYVLENLMTATSATVPATMPASIQSDVESIWAELGATEGNGEIVQGSGILYGSSGADVVTGGGSDDYISGFDGIDVLRGGGGDDVIRGHAGSDFLDGDSGADVLYGGMGNDRLEGDSGADVFLFGRGDGADLIVDTDHNDNLVFGDDITSQDLWFVQDGDDLVIHVMGTDDKVTVEEWFAPGSNEIGEIYASDLKLTDNWVDDLISLMAGTSSVVPDAMPASIASAVDGYWIGGSSNAWQEYAAGHSRTPDLEAMGSGGPGVLVDPEQGGPTYGSDGDDIVGSSTHDVVFGLGGVDFIDISSGGKFLFGNAGDDHIRGTGNGTVLYGGLGNDRLEGDGGTFLFARGDGQDVIFIEGPSSNKLVFGDGIGWQDLWFMRDGDDLVINVIGTDDRVTIEKHFLNSDHAIDEIKTADEGVSNLQSLIDTMAAESATVPNAMPQSIVSTVESYWQSGGSSAWLDYGSGHSGAPTTLVGRELDDVLLGTAGRNVIRGSGGDDTLKGFGGGDTLTGGAGADLVYGHAGNDTILGGSGGDILYGGVGDDTLRGDSDPMGQDGGGNDIFLFGEGDGSDTIFADLNGNKLVFSDTLTPEDLWFDKVGSDLDIYIIGTNDKVRIIDMFGSYPVNTPVDSIIVGGDHVLDSDDVYNLAVVRMGGSPPSSMPSSVANILDNYWSPTTDTTWADYGAGNADQDASTAGVGTGPGILVVGTPGNDQLSGTSNHDEIEGGDGSDQLAGYEGQDRLEGGSQDDQLFGHGGGDWLFGGAGDDILYGGVGDDLIYGDADDHGERTENKGGNDTYLFGVGDGSDVIYNIGSDSPGVADNDRLVFADTLTPEDLWFVRDVDDLIIHILGTDDKVRIDNHFDNWPEGEIDEFIVGGSQVLEDGDVNNVIAIMDNYSQIPATMPSSVANQIDNYWSSTSDDTWAQYGAGKANITESNPNPEPPITLVGTSGADQLSGGSQGDDLDGAGGDDVLKGFEGQDVLKGGGDNDELLGHGGADTLFGGGGDDVLYGGVGDDHIYGDATSVSDRDTDRGGNDIYLFGTGDGSDVIYNAGEHSPSSLDKLIFSDTLTPEDLWFVQEGNDLVVHILGTNDNIRVDNFFGTSPIRGEIDHFIVGGNRLLLDNDVDSLINIMNNYSQIPATMPSSVANQIDNYWSNTSDNTWAQHGAGNANEAAPPPSGGGGGGSEPGQTLVGTSGSDQLIGGSGDDDIDGKGGSDQLEGHGGNDLIKGGSSGDTLYGHAANDVLLAGTGSDVLYGGLGNDDLYGDADIATETIGTDHSGSDTYLFGRGDGTDRIFNPNGGTDKLVFADDLTQEDLWFVQEGNDVIIHILGTQDSIRIVNMFGSGSNDGEIDDIYVGGNKRLRDYHVDNVISIMASYTEIPETMPASVASQISSYWTSSSNGDWAQYGAGNAGEVPEPEPAGGEVPSLFVPPVALDDWVTSFQMAPVQFDPRMNDHDPSGGDVTIISVSGADFGSVEIQNGGAMIQYTPHQYGFDEITYTVMDSDGNTANATISVAISHDGSFGAIVDGDEGQDKLVGGTGLVRLQGEEGDDFLYGGDTGSFDLEGGSGNDTYVIGGQDNTIDVFDQSSGTEGDRMIFADGTDFNDLWFSQQGNQLIIENLETNSVVTVDEWFAGHEVETIETAGHELGHADVNLLIQAMASAPKPAGEIDLTDPTYANVASTLAATWEEKAA